MDMFVESPVVKTGAWLAWKLNESEVGSDTPGVAGWVLSSSISQRKSVIVVPVGLSTVFLF
ncbi:MAG: hypothetical protein JRI34_04400 [Deltaproteobacteria bacterium]|nr:hypothetical protein [Deltaproteobacteria bacterium]